MGIISSGRDTVSIATWHITNSANEWGILNSSFAEVFMIIVSYSFGFGRDLQKVAQVGTVL